MLGGGSKTRIMEGAKEKSTKVEEPDPSSSLVEMFEQVYSFGKIPISEDAEDQAFQSAFAAAQMEKAGYICVGIVLSAALSINFPRRLMAFAAIAPVSLVISSYMPHPMLKSVQATYPRMAQKYEQPITAYYEKVFVGPPLSYAKRTDDQKNAEHKERGLKVKQTTVNKREFR